MHHAALFGSGDVGDRVEARVALSGVVGTSEPLLKTLPPLHREAGADSEGILDGHRVAVEDGLPRRVGVSDHHPSRPCVRGPVASRHDEIGECSYCGVFRRFCLNKKTKELGVDRLVTGHNLDDMAQSVLMNFTNGDMQKLARLGPHSRIQPGLVPRFLPLRTIPEKEVMLYALVKNIEFHNAECPYSTRALRGSFRELLDTLEENTPGTRHSILKSYESIKELLLEQYPPVTLNTCPSCGEPTSQQMCKTCLLKKRIMG